MKKTPEISIVLPTYNEGGNVSPLIERLRKVLDSITRNYEIIVVDGHSKDSTRDEARKAGAKMMIQKEKGYGAALKEGFAAAAGDYIITMDADLSHDPVFIRDLWKKRKKYEVIIASRNVTGGKADMPLQRRVLSRMLNMVFAFALSTPLKDLSSGYRMYNANALREIKIIGNDFNVLQEILVRMYNSGFRVTEIPFHYKPRKEGKTKARPLKFALSYLRTLKRLWVLRNSIEAADYDGRAYDSKIIPQRYWQRKRHKAVMKFLDEKDKTGKNKVLDIGCGSSRIIQDLPNAVALEYNFIKLRYLKRTNKFLVNADINHLPLKNESFDTVICSQVIEHIKHNDETFTELSRVLKRNGKLIIGTPDYDTMSWRFWEWIYRKVLSKAYADEHITHYSQKRLRHVLGKHGFRVIQTKYVFGAEMVMLARKE